MLVYGKYECFVMHMLYVCVLCVSCGSYQCCILHDLRPYSRAGPMTSVSFCLPYPVYVSAFIICSGLCVCTEMLSICVLYVRFGSKVRPRTLGALSWIVKCCLF